MEPAYTNRRWWALVALLGVAGAGCDKGDTVTAPQLSATCRATPGDGAAPLEVAFVLDVAGAEGAISVSVSYGDGATGTNPDASHTYGAAGLYTASFDVRTASQAARCATTVSVSAPEPSPSPPPNLPPVAWYKTNPDAKNGQITGTAPFFVKFNMCRTYDPEDDPLYFTMDFQADGLIDVRGRTGASCREGYDYTAGTWSPQICVTDVTPAGQALHPVQCRTYIVKVTP
jgi:hypothetical protein